MVVGPDRARQHLEQRDLADVRVGDRLEHERERVAVGIGRHLDLGVARLHLDRRPVGGRRADLADEVGQPVDRDVGRGRAEHDREHRRLGDALGERVLELVASRSLAAEVALEQLVVGDDDALDEVVVHLVLELGELVGDLAVRRLAAVVEVRGVGQEVGDAAERGLLADRQLERRDAGAEPVADLVERALEVGALTVELVDEHHARDAELRPRSSRSRRSGPRRPRPR